MVNLSTEWIIPPRYWPLLMGPIFLQTDTNVKRIGGSDCSGRFANHPYRARDDRIFSCAPGAMRLLESRFQLLILATVVLKSWAMAKSVSPCLTL